MMRPTVILVILTLCGLSNGVDLNIDNPEETIVLKLKIRFGKPDPDIKIEFPFLSVYRLHKALCDGHAYVAVSASPHEKGSSVYAASTSVKTRQSAVQIAYQRFYDCTFDVDSETIQCVAQRAGVCHDDRSCISINPVNTTLAACRPGAAGMVWDPDQTVSVDKIDDQHVRMTDCQSDCYSTTTPHDPTTDPSGSTSGQGGDGDGSGGSGDNLVIIVVAVAVAVIVLAVVIGAVVCCYLQRRHTPGKQNAPLSDYAYTNEGTLNYYRSDVVAPPSKEIRPALPPPRNQSHNADGTQEETYDYIDDYARLDETTKYAHDYKSLQNAGSRQPTSDSNSYQLLEDEAPSAPPENSYHELEAEVPPAPDMSSSFHNNQQPRVANEVSSSRRDPGYHLAGPLPHENTQGQQHALPSQAVAISGPHEQAQGNARPKHTLPDYSLATQEMQIPQNEEPMGSGLTSVNEITAPAPQATPTEVSTNQNPATPREYLEILEPQPEVEPEGGAIQAARGTSILTFPDRKQINSKEMERILGPQPPVPRPTSGPAYYSQPTSPHPLE